MSALRVKSEVASWSIKDRLTFNTDLRHTYMYKLIDFLLFKTELKQAQALS